MQQCEVGADASEGRQAAQQVRVTDSSQHRAQRPAAAQRSREI